MGLAVSNNKLFAVSHSKYYIWNSLPSSANQSADVESSPLYTRERIHPTPDREIFPLNQIDYSFGIASDGKRLFIADTNNNRILIWNEIPENSKKEADIQLGKPEMFCSRNSFPGSPAPFCDGEKLVVGVDGVGVWIYNRLPDESKAEADVVVGAIDGKTIIGGPAIIAGEKLIMTHREGSKVVIWNEIPKRDNQLPDVVLGTKVDLADWGAAGKGRIGLNNPQMAATDGKSLFVADTGNNRILVWNEIPTENQTPADFVLGQPNFDTVDPKPLPPIPESVEGIDLYGLDNPIGISSDGKRLAVIDRSHRVLIWSLPIKENNQRPDVILLGDVFQRKGPLHFEGPPKRWYHPQGVCIYGDALFIVDGSGNRVLIWNKLPTKIDDLPDLVLGQNDFSSTYPSNSKKNFAVFPASISFDGSFLWVGEMKWSNRLLRFSVQPIE
jgi:hypothetical protein